LGRARRAGGRRRDGRFAIKRSVAIQDRIEATYAACRSVDGVVAMPIDDRFLRNEKLLWNLTHPGMHGNRELGTWLAASLPRGAWREVAARTTSEGVGR
jgi:hypothetical protein